MIVNKFKNKHVSIYLLVISIMLVFSIITGISYSLWSSSVSQGDENAIDTDCFKITINGSNDILLKNAYPISDEKGSQLTPYTFTIKNICNHNADYQINLETINTSTLKDYLVKIKFDDQDPLLYKGNRQVKPTLPDASNAFKLKEGTLVSNGEETHYLRIWLDENTTLEEAENKSFKSKVTVNSTLNVDGTVKGDLKNITLHTFGGTMDGSTISSVENTMIGNLPEPSKKGYKFSAWYSDSELTNLVTRDTILTPQLTDLYAKYEIGEYQLIFNTDGGTITTDGLERYVDSHKIIDHSENVSDTGKRTSSYSNYTSDIKHISFGEKVNAHLKLIYGTESTSYDYVCIFKGNVTPTTDNNNCSTSLSNSRLGGHGTPADSPVATAWETDIDASEITVFFKTDSSENDYYGYYLEITYDTGYVYKTVAYNSEYGELPTAEKDGYNFLGWYLDDVKINSENIFELDDYVELTAKWKGNVTTFVDGKTINSTFKSLAKGSSVSYSTKDTLITSIQRSDELLNDSTLISTSDSPAPAYAWYDSGTIYWYSDVDKVYLNPDSSSMFKSLTKLLNLNMSDFDSSKVTDMSGMFAVGYALNGNESSLLSLDVSTLDTSNVTNMKSMFETCEKITSLDLSNFNTEKVTDMSYMFNYVENVTNLDLTSFNTIKVTNMTGMFAEMRVLENINFGENFNTSNVTSMGGMEGYADGGGMFQNCNNLKSLDLSSFNTSKVTSMKSMFSGVRSIETLDLSSFNTSNVTTMSGMFAYMSSLKDLDITNFNTSNVLYMGPNSDVNSMNSGTGMFCGMTSLTSLDLSNFNTSKVISMKRMFSKMTNLLDLNITSFDTSSVVNMEGMFSGMSSLSSITFGSNWNTSKVTTMYSMFAKMTSLTSIDLSSFDTSKVTNMQGMFGGMTSLTSLDLSTFSSLNLTTIGSSSCSGICNNGMFEESSNLESIIFGENFTLSKVTNMYAMFRKCSSLVQLDLKYFDTSKVTNMYGMFREMSSLTTIYVGSGWSTNAVTNGGYIFYQDSNLLGGSGTSYDSSYVNVSYARIDGGPDSDTPGYLTDIADKPTE